MNNEMGKFSLKSDGIILGHEFSGIVEELGEEAAKALKVIRACGKVDTKNIVSCRSIVLRWVFNNALHCRYSLSLFFDSHQFAKNSFLKRGPLQETPPYF